jgi:pimeloyl-ACP methyl ester carboxylesterase
MLASPLTVYFISGLGIDQRVFQKMQFSTAITIKHLEWIEPLPKETLQEYAQRLSKDIDTTRPYTIAGLSFGGMVATEIAKLLHPEHVFLISSASTVDEIPGYYKFLYRLRLLRVIPPAFFKIPTPFTYWLFDIHTKEEKKMLKAVLKDMKPYFIKWALNSILSWKNNERPRGTYHIHGTVDKILPLKHVHADVEVEGGGHLMVYTCAEQVVKLMEKRLSSKNLQFDAGELT